MIRKHAKRAPRPIPQKVRTRLLAGAVLMVAIAAVANVGHTQEHASHYGQRGIMAWVIAFIPDGILILSIMRLRYDRSSLAAWAGVSGAAGLVAWASVSTTTVDGPGAKIVSLVALIAAIIATGLLHGGPEAETLEQFVARTERALAAAEAAVRNATRDAEQAIAGITEQATATGARVAELEATLVAERAANRAALDAAHEATRNVTAAARTKPAGKRTAGAPKTPVRSPNGPDDLHRRTEIRDRYIASVRAGEPMSNADLATALYGAHDGGETVLGRARVTASRWRKDAGITAPATAAEVTV